MIVDDADLTPHWMRRTVMPLLTTGPARAGYARARGGAARPTPTSARRHGAGRGGAAVGAAAVTPRTLAGPGAAADELGAGAPGRHRRRRDERHRPDPARPRRARCPGSDARDTRDRCSRCARWAPAVRGRPRRLRHLRRRRHRRGVHRDPRRQPRAGRGPRARDAGAAARRGAGRGDGRPPRRRRRRHPRQDVDHLDADRRRCSTRRSTRRSRSAATSTSPGSNAHARRAATSSSPRPTRATVRSCCWPRTARSSPTSRPTTSTTTAPRGRTTRRSTGSSTGSTRAASLVVCADDPGAAPAARPCRARARCSPTAGRPTPTCALTELDVRPGRHRATRATGCDGAELRPGARPVPGEHMALNAPRRRCSPALELGLPADGLSRGWPRFSGVHRRFELKGRGGGVRVYDDYAHHPTEVARRSCGPPGRSPARGRLVVVFQPHLYCRTRSSPTGSAPRWGSPTRSW